MTVQTVVVLRVTHQAGMPWWRALGLPRPFEQGDDDNFVYVVRAASVAATVEEAKAA